MKSNKFELRDVFSYFHPANGRNEKKANCFRAKDAKQISRLNFSLSPPPPSHGITSFPFTLATMETSGIDMATNSRLSLDSFAACNRLKKNSAHVKVSFSHRSESLGNDKMLKERGALFYFSFPQHFLLLLIVLPLAPPADRSHT
jgi:hypothetical protein